MKQKHRQRQDSHLHVYGRFCGPSVLASVTRLPRFSTAALLWNEEKPTGRDSGSTNVYTIGSVLGRYVYEVQDRVTVARWLRENDAEAILRVSSHFIHVKGGEILQDNGAPKRRGYVTHVIFLNDDDHVDVIE